MQGSSVFLLLLFARQLFGISVFVEEGIVAGSCKHVLWLIICPEYQLIISASLFFCSKILMRCLHSCCVCGGDSSPDCRHPGQHDVLVWPYMCTLIQNVKLHF